MISISGLRGAKKPLTVTRSRPKPASIAARYKNGKLFNIIPPFNIMYIHAVGHMLKKVSQNFAENEE